MGGFDLAFRSELGEVGEMGEYGRLVVINLQPWGTRLQQLPPHDAVEM